MSGEEDYTEGDRYDWDQSDPRQHCKHGTFIGSWWGPDILCGPCEDGSPDITIRQLREAKQDVVDRQLKWWGNFGGVIATITREENAMLSDFVKSVVARHNAEQDRWDEDIAEASEWAESEDDDDWLNRRHSAMINSYRERENV